MWVCIRGNWIGPDIWNHLGYLWWRSNDHAYIIIWELYGLETKKSQYQLSGRRGSLAVAMITTQKAVRTYYFRTRTGEFRGVTTRAFIISGLRHNFQSLKACKGLDRQGYCVLQHPDPEESAIYPVSNGQTDKSKYFCIYGWASCVLTKAPCLSALP